jgi:hypothetical protein
MKYKPAEQYKAQFQKSKLWLFAVGLCAAVSTFFNNIIESLYED